MPYDPVYKNEYFKQPLDFFARRRHFIDHIAPIWDKLDGSIKGKFYVPSQLIPYANSLGIDAVGLSVLPRSSSSIRVRPPGKTPVLTSAYGDMEQAWHEYALRPLILMEHGVGLVFPHPGYAGGDGLRRRVALFLAPNRNIYEKTYGKFPAAPQVIIGTPKLDNIITRLPEPKEDPLIAISFHWDGSAVSPEAGNAFSYYKDVLPAIASKYRVIGHGHPKIIDRLTPFYLRHGIKEIEKDFRKVINKADIYINDASSTLYEFSTTGKPVIILNAPWFRKTVNFGIRFWEYTDIGVNVDNPCELIPAIERTTHNPTEFYANRLNMIEDLYPNMGYSAQRAADALKTFMESKRNGTTFSFE